MNDPTRATIILGDGNPWEVPKPLHDEPGDYFAVLERLLQADEDVIEQVELIATLAATLIRRGHDVADEDLGRLLPLTRALATLEWEPSNRAMWEALFGLVSGDSGPEGSTRARWLRLSAIRLGIHRGVVLLEDLADLTHIEVAGESFPPAGRWVGWIADRAAMERNASSVDSLILGSPCKN